MKALTIPLAVLTFAATAAAQAPYLVADLTTTQEVQSSAPRLFALSDGHMIGAVTDPANGTELWISDGTLAGSRLVLDINPGPGSSSPYQFTELDGVAYFFANDQGEPGSGPPPVRQLWRSDGTAAGTWLVKQFDGQADGPFPVIDGLMTCAGSLFLVGDDGLTGRELWHSDGTLAGTEVVKDIVPGSGGSSPWSLLCHGGALLFSVWPGASGVAGELWRSDGSEMGTQVIHTFHGTYGVAPQLLARIGDRVYFSGWDEASGQELWLTDGKPEGTTLVKDIAPGSANSSPMPIGEVKGGLLFFNYNTPKGLWFSDGTDAGTVQLRPDIFAPTDSYLVASARVGELLLFPAQTSAKGMELYVTDGTAQGTVMLADISYGSRGSSPQELVELGGRVVFVATESTRNRELWITDGTPGGTSMVKDILPGYEGSRPVYLVRSGERVFFTANDGANGSELWVSDGTSGGTYLSANLAADVASSSFGATQAVADDLFFTTSHGLWISNGTAPGTVLLSTVEAAELARVGKRLLFRGHDPGRGSELWVSNGTRDGTFMLRDIVPGSVGSHPRSFTPVGTRAIFRTQAPDGTGSLWHSDGTLPGTDRLQLSNRLTPSGKLGSAAGTFYFADSAGVIWHSDGRTEGHAITGPTPYDGATPIAYLLGVGQQLLFTTNDSIHGRELWRSDGSAGGTRLVRDICPGSCSSTADAPSGVNLPGTFAVTPTLLFFLADDGEHGRELWRSDGTSGGTWLLGDLTPGAAGSPITLLGSLGSLAFFAFDDGVHGLEPWVSDGTPVGTRLLADINPGLRDSRPANLVRAGANVVFVASTDQAGRELWRSDGTAGGTTMVTDLVPGPSSSSPGAVTAADHIVFFSADDGAHGAELWAFPYEPVNVPRRRLSR